MTLKAWELIESFKWVIQLNNLHGEFAAQMREPARQELVRAVQARSDRTSGTAERAGDRTARLARQEEARALPWGAVWDQFCETRGVPAGDAWLEDVRTYEKNVLSRRG